MHESTQYIPSSEGERLLGVKRSLFFYYVTSGQIRTQPATTEREQNLYSYEDILRIKEKRARKRKKPATNTLIDWMKIADMPNTLKLDFIVFEEANVPIGDINLYISWLKRNPYLTLTAFDANDRSKVLAYISLLPLPEHVILKVLRGERTETDIQAEEIETYEREGGYTLLAEGVVAHPDHTEQLSAVLRKLIDYWCEQYPQRYIEKIYAQAASDRGDILIQKLYFAPRYDLAENAYVLDLKRKAASRIIRQYQDCITNKQRLAQQDESRVRV
jgi:hypothetical protein